MANIDKVSVKNTVYNIVSPAVVSDYIEVIGGACTKPDGYVEDEVILAKQNDVQLLFKATQDIAFGANIVENTNCVRTTLEEVLKNAGGGGGASSADQVSYDNSDSGLEAENVQEAVDELATNAGTASSQIQTLTNKLTETEMHFLQLKCRNVTIPENEGVVTINFTQDTIDALAALFNNGNYIYALTAAPFTTAAIIMTPVGLQLYSADTYIRAHYQNKTGASQTVEVRFILAYSRTYASDITNDPQ